MSPDKQAADDAPNCWQCRHFAVSWDPKVPYLCRLMGFKSRIVPSIEVLRADGQRCRGYIPKSVASAPTTAASSTTLR